MFKDLNQQVQENLKKLLKTGRLFQVNVDRDKIWKIYLSSFPEKYRQENNCNCCKSFLRQYGGIVAIINNHTVTLWDGIKFSSSEDEEEYSASIQAVNDYIKSLPVSDLFYAENVKCGTEKSPDLKRNLTWNHFYVEMPRDFVKTNIPTLLGEKRADKDVLKRSLEEITSDAVETVIELIRQGSIYRGNEFKGILDGFLSLKKKYNKVKPENRDNYCWQKAGEVSPAICRIKNTSIGTLLNDLSGGMELDLAVKRFESVVAPANYKRTTSLITPKMITDAQKTIMELGLESALERRFARPTDIKVDNILWTARGKVLKSVFDQMAEESVVSPKSFSKVETIGIEKFISDVLPTAKTVEVLLELPHLNKFVSIMTGDEHFTRKEKDGKATKLFKWNNPFSWAYSGGITDSIVERVKAAGGNVTGELRISLPWNNYDDLDLHLFEPGRVYSHTRKDPPYHIYYANRYSASPLNGRLDVDANAGSGQTREPVENIFYKTRPQDGRYRVHVNNFCAREKNDQGYTVQIEYLGQTWEYSFPDNKTNTLNDIYFTLKNGEISFEVDGKTTIHQKEKWGIKTNQFIKVKNIMLSPNYWDGEPPGGNKHYFFILDGAKSDEKTRTIFNEYLDSSLDKHRKVFEVLGGKLAVEPTEEQVSGVGFSETQRNHIYVRVEGQTKRVIKVEF